MTSVYRKRNTRWRNLTIGVLILGLSMGGTAWADPHTRRHAKSYPPQGRIYKEIPAERRPVYVGKDRYYFHSGIYYRQDPRGYRVVRPPRGTVIHHMPLGVETLIVAGITYFLLAGIYYQKAPTGYVVVDAPPETSAVVDGGSGALLAVDVAMLNVRSGPGMDHPVVGQVRLGQHLVVEGSSTGWFYVRLPDGSFGWVMAKFTRQVAPGAMG